MENIDRVNRFFILRCLFFPATIIVLIQYYLKKYSLYKSSKRYVLGHEDRSEDMRYEQLLSLFSKWLYFENMVFFFHFDRRINNHQHVFVVNDNLDWPSISLISYLIKNLNLPYPRFLLNNIFITKGKKAKLPPFWDFIDTFYGDKDLDRAINSRRSFVIEKSFFDRHPIVVEKLKNSHLSIIPICYRRQRNRIWYVSGDQIKTSNLASFRSEAFVESINNAFFKLENKTDDLIAKSKQRKKLNLKGLFTIN